MHKIWKYNKGITDIQLSGNPEISFFSKVYRKHTQFGIQRVRMYDVQHGVQNQINYHGDLIKSIDLEIRSITFNHEDIPIPDNIGTTILGDITLRTSNKQIEKLSGSYIEMYYQLNNPISLHSFYETIPSDYIEGNKVTCNTGSMFQKLTLSGGVFNLDNKILGSDGVLDVILPIPFSFASITSLSLPYLLFHLNNPLNIRFEIDTALVNTVYTKFNFIINYIYLEEEEKQRFKSSTNEYIIQKVEPCTITLKNGILEYKIPPTYGNIKSIIWKNINNYYDYNISINNILVCRKNKSYHYWTKHNIKRYNLIGGGRKVSTDIKDRHIISDNSIAIYTFGLDDKKNDSPSGSVNSHKNKIAIIIDDTETTDTLQNYPDFTLYIISYNILTITDGNIKLNYTN